MHKGVKPLWEDPQNERGGAWNFRIAKASTPVVWRELLMALVGEQFEDTIAPGTSSDFFFFVSHLSMDLSYRCTPSVSFIDAVV